MNGVAPVYLVRNSAIAFLIALEILISSGDAGSKKRSKTATKASNWSSWQLGTWTEMEAAEKQELNVKKCVGGACLSMKGNGLMTSALASCTSGNPAPQRHIHGSSVIEKKLFMGGKNQWTRNCFTLVPHRLVRAHPYDEVPALHTQVPLTKLFEQRAHWSSRSCDCERAGPGQCRVDIRVTFDWDDCALSLISQRLLVGYHRNKQAAIHHKRERSYRIIDTCCRITVHSSKSACLRGSHLRLPIVLGRSISIFKLDADLWDAIHPWL